MKNFLRKIYHFVKAQTRTLRHPWWGLVNLAYMLGLKRLYNLPVVINNFNRLTYPSQLIHFLEQCGFTNIIILDNNSTYPPLLEFYKTCKHTVVRTGKNFGHLAFWKSGLYEKYKWDYFIYTDSDVLPIEMCPKDFIIHFKSTLDKYAELDKVGFGIKIDDLPDFFSAKEKIVKYEERYWQHEAVPGFYEANIDTTFALYRPLSDLKQGEVYTLRAWRSNFPYLIRHMPWYTDLNNPSEEEAYYIKTSNSSSSISQLQKGATDIY